MGGGQISETGPNTNRSWPADPVQEAVPVHGPAGYLLGGCNCRALTATRVAMLLMLHFFQEVRIDVIIPETTVRALQQIGEAPRGIWDARTTKLLGPHSGAILR